MINRRIQILFFLCIPILGFSQSGNDLVVKMTSRTESFEPGKIHTLVFRLNNPSENHIQIQPYLSLPTGIKLISDLKPLNLAPKGQNILIITLNIPSKYKAGKYDFSLRLVNPANPSVVHALFSSGMTVKEEPSIRIDLVHAPDYVKAGDPIEASFVVRNTGNTTADLHLTATNCYLDGPTTIRLAPENSAVVNVVSETNENLSIASRKSFHLSAENNNIESVQQSAHVRIMPTNIDTEDLYHRFPVSLTARYLTKGKDGIYTGGYQLEAKGSGSIDPEGIHKVEFVARGPNQFDLSLLGLYDEYSLNYTNRFMKVKIGDNSFSMTPLTEYARYGRGIEQSITFLRTSQAGVMYLSPRFYKNFTSEYGAYVKFGIYKKNGLGFYYLRKKLALDENINLYSITANLQPLERTSLEMEASYGEKNGVTDVGYRINVNSQFSGFSLSSFYLHAGKNYPGYYSNSNYYAGHLNYYIARWLTIGLNARQDFMNAQVDTLLMTSPFSRFYQAHANFRIGKRIYFKFYIRQNEKEDRSASKKFNYKTLSVNTSLTHRLKRFGYNLEGEYGNTKNFLLNETENQKNTYRLSGNFYWQPNQKHNIQGFITYTNLNSFISSQEENNFIFGLTASGSLARNLQANLQLQNTYSIEEYYRNRNLMQLIIDYRFLKRHRLTLNSFYTIFQNEVSGPDYSISLSYSLTLGIPLKKVAEAGFVTGKIENAGVEKISDIVVSVGGQSAMTDESGAFSFKNLKPGTYNLLIDRSTVNMEDIPDIRTPITISVEGNQETVVEFGLTKAAKVRGMIQFETDDTQRTAKESIKPFGQIVMELSQDKESIRIISDKNGTFNFPNVRPGKWLLKVYSTGLDKQYVLKKDHFDLLLSPDEVKELTIVLQKKKRNIIFIKNNINLSSEGNK
jgi:hypothetical protein